MTVFREQPETRSINMNFCISFISAPIPTTADELLFPVLVDKKNHTIVSNESAEIIRMFNTAFDALGAKAGDYYPPALQRNLTNLTAGFMTPLTTACIKLVFPTSQQAYDEAVEKVFESLARLRDLQSASLPDRQPANRSRYSPVDHAHHFDPVYVTHFKCDKHRISDYLNLYGFLRDIYQMPGIAETVNF